MKREKALFIIFICCGLIICASSLWLILVKKNQLRRFADRISSRQIAIYPTRAAIYDCNGTKIAWTEWSFYIQSNRRYLKNMENFFHALNLEFKPLYNNTTRRYTQIIPPEKVTDAIQISRRYKMRVRRSIVRKTIELSPAAQNYIGHVLYYYGISGKELEKNNILQGRAGIYRITQGASGKIAEKSLKVMLPMQQGAPVHLDLSLFELQSGLYITEGGK